MSGVPNNSSGIWTAIYFGGTANFRAGEKGEVFVSDADKSILQNLAHKVRILSERSRESEKRDLWYRHNDLKEKYPIVLTDPENGWNEIITEDMLKCTGTLAKRWEWSLRREIFWGDKIQDDRPVEAVFEITYTFSDTEWGIDGIYHGGENGSSYTWEPAINNPEDIEQIKIPQVSVDYATTEETLGLARSVFGDILEVKLRGINWHSPHMSWDLGKMVGMETMMIMMYDDPDTLKKIMEKFVQGHLARLDFLEENGLLTLNNDYSYVGSGGIGYTNDLPIREIVQGNNILTSDQWLHTESQETVGVSPEMFEEFIFPYQLPLQKRFGLNRYGCCEPIDPRWHIVKRIPNLRALSVSPWANEDKMAEYLEDKYIYSRKPNPADLARPQMDEAAVRKSLSDTLQKTKGCIVELVMKDNHTIGKNPDNIVNWVKIAREEIEKEYGKQ